MTMMVRDYDDDANDDAPADNNDNSDNDNNSFNFIIFFLTNSIAFLLFFSHKGRKSSDGGAVLYTTFGA